MPAIQRVRMAGMPKNGKSGPHCWGRGGSTQFAQQLEFAVTASPLVGCVVWSLMLCRLEQKHIHITIVITYSSTNNTTMSQTPYHSQYITPKQHTTEKPVVPRPNSEQTMSPTTLIFKQNRRSQTPITTMLSLQIRTTHKNTFVQLHQHKHTTTGHKFVNRSRGGGAPAD